MNEPTNQKIQARHDGSPTPSRLDFDWALLYEEAHKDRGVLLKRAKVAETFRHRVAAFAVTLGSDAITERAGKELQALLDKHE